MRKWEDIIKDKLEEADGELPESVFAEFRARRGGAVSGPAPARKGSPLLWALVPAVAAGLAAVLLLRHPAEPDNAVQIVQQPLPPVAMVDDSANVTEPIQSEQLIAQVAKPRIAKRPDVTAQKTVPAQKTAPAQNTEIQKTEPENPEIIDNVDTSDPTNDVDSDEEKTVTAPGSPYVPENPASKPVVKIKMAPITGIVAGGGLVAALASNLSRTTEDRDINLLNNGGHNSYADYANLLDGSSLPDKTNANTPQTPVDVLQEAAYHSPIKFGLSVGIPVARRLNVTTGVDYSRFVSKFRYSLSGDKTQVAHYLGIPVRLDWAFVSNRWVGVYVGGGIEADYCVAAKFAGVNIKRDGLGFSLLGAGGLQFNMTKRLGLYVEPQLSWNIPSSDRVIKTYRSENPLMFTAAGGLRFNLGR